jgi:hypothetical protein
MSQDIAVRTPQPVALDLDHLKMIANTNFVPPGLRGNLPAIMAAVATGRELGLGDMSALRSIHIIDGKATFSAELMVMLVRRHGHSVTGEVSANEAKVTGTRSDTGDTMTSVWTLEMAKRAGLLGKSNWAKYPEAMLWARAASQLCRMLFADCFAGGTYTAEELEDVDTIPAAAPAAMSATITEAQKKKANVLVGQLRDAEGRLTTEDIYAAAGKRPAEFVDDDGELHWAPLRDSLTKREASVLIDRLQQFDDSGAEDVIGVEWAKGANAPVSGESDSGAAAFESDSPDAGLSPAQFKKLLADAGIPADVLLEAAHRLFPGASSTGELDRVQLGELWEELTRVHV